MKSKRGEESSFTTRQTTFGLCKLSVIKLSVAAKARQHPPLVEVSKLIFKKGKRKYKNNKTSGHSHRLLTMTV